MRKTLWLALVATLLFSAFQIGGNRFYELNNKQLTLPENYQTWQYVGSATVPNEHNNNKAIFPGIHNVYIDPDSYRHRQDKGVFRDGTIIVMDVLHMTSRESEGGFGYFTTGGQDILVKVKDRRVFDNGGWGYFLFNDKDLKSGKKVADVEDSRCRSCHQASAEDDETFSQYYPALKRP